MLAGSLKSAVERTVAMKDNMLGAFQKNQMSWEEMNEINDTLDRELDIFHFRWLSENPVIEFLKPDHINLYCFENLSEN